MTGSDGGAVAPLSSLTVQESYTTSTDDLLSDFLVPCLDHAIRYDRLAGFFSSAVLALAPFAFADFFSRGGKARLICSPQMSLEDAQALTLAASASRDILREAVVSELRALTEASPQALTLTTALSSMVRAGVLEVKIAVPRAAHGLFHDKTGIFTDSDDARVSFVGSANETAAAWSGFVNHEQLEVFASWWSHESSQRSRRHARTFEETWRNLRRGLQVLDVADASELIQSAVRAEPLEDALAAVRSLRQRELAASSQGDRRTLLDHQKAVLDHWEVSGFRGLVAFATGAGKTLTGIEAINRWTRTGRPAIALVPSELLQAQWSTEIRAELPDLQLLRAGGVGHRRRWMDALHGFTTEGSDLGPRCVLATYQTARTRDFLDRVDVGDHLLVMADEVHRIGSPDTRVIMDTIRAGGRLGLSATPDRFGDPVGTSAIYSYFGARLLPAYSLRDAIKDHRLVPYLYFFETVSLNDDEQADYDKLTQTIRRVAAIARTSANADQTSLESLLRLRARILKRAEAKAVCARDVLRERYRPGQRWLVYCESTEHLRQVRDALEQEAAANGMPLLEYHQQMPGDRAETLSYFQNNGGTLLAIKCLDEGVDIPATDHALILASTSNPREYVQRRGRVLRASDGKFNAVVVDTIVTDVDGVPLAQSELERAFEFASDAENKASRFAVSDLLALCGDDRWRTITADQDIEGDDDDGD